ncbi:MAG: HIT domain-containing protein [Candidatus Paceibacterota bacterium]
MKYSDFLKERKGCPFCDVKDEIIAENKSAYLTYALAPYHKHHLLVVPKKHTDKILDVSDDEMKDVYSLLKNGLGILKNLGYGNISLLVREGNEIGKSVPHLHYHIIPNIRVGDLDHEGNERKVLNKEEIADTMADIKAVMQ